MGRSTLMRNLEKNELTRTAMKWLRNPLVPYGMCIVLLIYFLFANRGCNQEVHVERIRDNQSFEDVFATLPDHLIVEPPNLEPAGSQNGDSATPIAPSYPHQSEKMDITAELKKLPAGQVAEKRLDSGVGQFALGKHMCILQPVKSVEQTWTEQNIHDHVALKAFLPSFVDTVDPELDRGIHYSIFYGYDILDPAFGNETLKTMFESIARDMIKNVDASLHFLPLFGLDGRLTGIWNDMARTAYHHGCDYFFMSNDDMALYTKGKGRTPNLGAYMRRLCGACISLKVFHYPYFVTGWASSAMSSFVNSKYRKCKYLGIVRFTDEWADWATFTFHVSTRLHMEIFREIYYDVPYHNSHNDLWIHWVYKHVGSNLNQDLHVRNRVHDYKTAKQMVGEEEPRYKYDEKADFDKWKLRGRRILEDWLRSAGERCQKTDNLPIITRKASGGDKAR